MKILDHGWSLGLDMPIAANSGTLNMNAEGGRHHMQGFGIGDIRLTAYKWIFDENVRRKGNIQVGLGIKFPTGNYHAKIIGTIVNIPLLNHCNPCLKRFNSVMAEQALLQPSMHFIFSTGKSVSLGIFSI